MAQSELEWEKVDLVIDSIQDQFTSTKFDSLKTVVEILG